MFYTLFPPSSGDTLVTAVFVIIVAYILLLIIWGIYAKDKSLKKFIHDAAPFLFAGVILYFWYSASGWESLLSENWSEYPEGSNLSAILEYTKALVKTVMLSVVVGVFWLYFKKTSKLS